MKNERIQDDDNIHKNYDWTIPLQTEGAVGNRSPKDPSKPKIFKKVYKNVSIPKQMFKKRQSELQTFQNEFSVPITFSDIKSKKVSKEQIIYTEFAILSQYVNSISVQNLIKQKTQLTMSILISIIQQIVDVMLHAEKQQVFHYHLNSNSILLIQFNNEQPQYLVKVTDWGFGNQICSRKDFKITMDFLLKMCKSSMFQYLHPELLFQMNNLDLYNKYRSKYDIWSFGIVMFRLTYLKRAFDNNGSFSPEILEQYYKKKKNLRIQNPSLVTTIIQKMLSFNEFNTWAEVKNFLIEKCERVQYDFLPIKDTLQHHRNLFIYLIEIYKVAAWGIHHSAHCFWYQNKPLMERFLLHLIKLMRIIHTKFIQRYGHRVGYLTQVEIKPYAKLINMVQSQYKLMERVETQKIITKDFFESFQKFMEFLIALQIRIQDLPSKSNYISEQAKGMHLNSKCKSLSLLKEFSLQMIKAKKNMLNCNKKILSSLYEAIPSKV